MKSLSLCLFASPALQAPEDINYKQKASTFSRNLGKGCVNGGGHRRTQSMGRLKLYAASAWANLSIAICIYYLTFVPA